jgi:hypothetical protein
LLSSNRRVPKIYTQTHTHTINKIVASKREFDTFGYSE